MDGKLITFRIDPSLQQLWDFGGLKQNERAEETRRLEAELMATYQNFVRDTHERLGNYQDALTEKQNEYLRVCKQHGISNPQIPKSFSSSIQDQIADIDRQIRKIERQNQPRISEIRKLYQQIQHNMDLLEISGYEREEFMSSQPPDYTDATLAMLRNRLESLQSEVNQRNHMIYSLKNELSSLIMATKESPDQFNELLDTKSISHQTIDQLEESIHDLRTRTENYKDQYDEYVHTIQSLYELLAIDQQDRLKIPTVINRNTLDLLQDEIEFLENQKPLRLRQIIEMAEIQVDQMANDLGVTIDHYNGDDDEAHLEFLKSQAQRLVAQKSSGRLSSTQPLQSANASSTLTPSAFQSTIPPSSPASARMSKASPMKSTLDQATFDRLNSTNRSVRPRQSTRDTEQEADEKPRGAMTPEEMKMYLLARPPFVVPTAHKNMN